MRARLAAYAGTQLRDFFWGRAPVLLGVTGLAAWAYFAVTGLSTAVFDPTGGIEGRDQLRRLFEAMLAAFGFAGGLMAVRGLMARDRWRGSDRVLFSRPMSPARYYGQAFAVTGVGTMALAAVAAEVFAVSIQPVSIVGTIAFVGLAWLVIGGLGFAVSALLRFDGFVVLLLIGLDLMLNAYIPHVPAVPGLAAAARVGQFALPPAHVIAGLRAPLSRGMSIDPMVLAWPVAFGVACIAGGLVALRRRPFRS